ncbi:MAG: class I SAM-dependent methyltransferase [Phycisphaerae bacterium]|nr:class I SAM-dependent methyltransferase [Phycisphaerae bacterium]
MPDPDALRGATLFSGRSSDYAAARPTYPDAVIDLIVEGLAPGAPAIDLGCGTGISTRLLASRGLVVVGMDPSEEMLAEARRAGSPVGGGSIRYSIGDERLADVADRSTDLIACFQSFHWVDPSTARRGFRRVLSPRGRVAVAWNLRQRGDPGAEAYVAAIGRPPADRADAGEDPAAGLWASPEAFREVARHRFPNPQSLDEAGLLARARSASYFPREPRAQARAVDALRRLFAAHARDGRVLLGQETLVVIAEPRP